MFILDDFLKQCFGTKLSPLRVQLFETSHQAFSVNNGNIPRWEGAIESIQDQPSGRIQYATPYLKINSQKNNNEQLETSLKQLMQ